MSIPTNSNIVWGLFSRISRTRVGPVIHMVLQVALVVCGSFITDQITWRTGILITTMLILGITLEFSLAKSERQFRAEVERSAQESVETFTSDLKRKADIFRYEAARTKEVINFICHKLRQTTALLSLYRGAHLRDLKIKKREILNETLEVLRRSLLNHAITNDCYSTDSFFKATYMEVQNNKDAEVLVFVAWSTPDGSVPTSVQEGKTFRKGIACAGQAWERRRVIVEDKFIDGSGWVDNYPGQGSLYKSMVCVPVTTSTGKDDIVIGVITIDTNIPGYFGKKNDRTDEARAGEVVRPFAEYIAFVGESVIAVTELGREWPKTS